MIAPRKRPTMYRVTVEEQRAAMPATFDAKGHALMSWRSNMARARHAEDPGKRAKFLNHAAIWRRKLADLSAARRA